MKVVLVTFANTGYATPERIQAEAKAFPFTDVIHHTEETIKEFVIKHAAFLTTYPHQFGFCIWKPYVILKSLLTLDEGDILVYADIGMHLNPEGIPRFQEYIQKLSDPSKSMIVFNTNATYAAQEYVKSDAYMYYYPTFINELNPYVYAGIMMVKHSADAINLLKDYLHLCEYYHLLHPGRSSLFKEFLPYFKGHDKDNALFALCVYKHRHCVSFIYPDEVNLYTNDGQQLGHAKNPTEDEANWSKLRTSPFQVRRIRSTYTT
jgi:hypothetical protein